MVKAVAEGKLNGAGGKATSTTAIFVPSVCNCSCNFLCTPLTG
jgi:hypothetical protein